MPYFCRMEPKLVKCEIHDLDLLAQLSLKTFSDAFASDNDADDFEAYLRSAFNSEKLQGELENDNSTFFFINSEDAIVGYFKINVGEAQTDLHDGNALELERIYVLKEFQGRQLGTWALKKVVSLAKDLGKQYVWLGVWEKNPNAIRFYEKHGFKKFGKHPYYIGNDRQTDWLMRLDLA